jgi:predicted membrane metal-binding protein
MAIWITCFSIGTQLARSRFLQAYLGLYRGGLLVSFLAFFVGKHFMSPTRRSYISLKYAVLVCLSLIWASYTNAPPLEPTDMVPSTYVVVKSSVAIGKGPVIIQTPQALYQSYGSRESGKSGDISWNSQSSLFTRQRSYFSGTTSKPHKASNNFYSRFIKSWFTNQSKSLGVKQMLWLNAVILGDLDQLPEDILRAVRVSGLHHLLVVSGLHLTMVTYLFYAFIGLIPTLGYALRFIPPPTWLEVQAFLRIGTASAALAYFSIVECPPNAERALISTVTFCILKTFFGSPPLLTHLQIMLVIQSIAFPVGIVGEANILGWGAYLLLSHARLKYGSNKSYRLIPLVVTQLNLCILGSAVFGELNLLPIIFMPALMPVFTLLITLTTLALALPEWIEPRVTLSHLHLSVQWLLFKLQAAVEQLPWLSNSHGALPTWFQPLALVVATSLLLNAIKTVKISQHIS